MNCLVINWISSRYKLAVKTSQHRYLCNNVALSTIFLLASSSFDVHPPTVKSDLTIHDDDMGF